MLTLSDVVKFAASAASRARARVVPLLAIGVLVALALWGGLWIRSAVWRATVPIHFGGDLGNAHDWGSRALDGGGYLTLYDSVRASRPDRRYGLDYPPLRLLVATEWVRWLRHRYPGFVRDGWPRHVVRPLLRLNLAAELATAVGLFLLVRTWTSPFPGVPPLPGTRSGPNANLQEPTTSRLRRGWARVGLDPSSSRGLAAALLFWFNPAVIVNSYVFPQWDVWLLPFFVFAVLLAVRDWWFGAGVLVAVGSMFKGQMLIVAPLFILWPLFSRQWGATARWFGGFATGVAAVTAPWLLGSRTGALWATTVLLSLALVRAWKASRPEEGTARWTALLLLVCTLWPWLVAPDRHGLWLGILFTGALIIATHLVPRGQARYLAACALAGALLIGGVALDGSLAWLHVGFLYRATEPGIIQSNVGNLGHLLRVLFGWRANTPLWNGSAVGLPIGPITLGPFLTVVYAGGLVLCSWAAAVHARGRDPRFLVAVTAPWVLLFALLPNARERYLVWGAGLTAVGSGVGWGMTVIHLVVTAVAWENESRTLLGLHPPFAPRLHAALEAFHPNGAWALLACCVALLWIATRPPRDHGSG